MTYEEKILTPFICETEEPEGEPTPETPEGGEEKAE